jgi:hypothetical protein
MSSSIVNNFIYEFNKLELAQKDIVINEIDKFIKNNKNTKLKNKIKIFLIEQKEYLLENFHTYEYIIDKIDCNDIKKFKKLVENELKTFDFDLEHSEFEYQYKFKLTIYFNNFTLIFEYNGYTDLKGNVKTNFEFKNDLKYNLILQEIIRSLYESDVHILLITIANLSC